MGAFCGRCRQTDNMKSIRQLALTTAFLFFVLSGHCNAAIVYPKAPEGGRRLVIECVGPLVQKHPDHTLAVPGLRMEDVTIAEPHRLYSVGAADLAAGHLLSSASSRSWRYILLHGTNAAGVASVSDPDSKTGKALSFNGLFETCFSNETLEAMRNANQLPKIRKEDYELRFLEVPAINFCAVWLHAKSDDIIMPLPPTFGRKLNAFQPCSESEIIKVLKPEAKEVVKAPNLFQ
jgi:hypothetical protein